MAANFLIISQSYVQRARPEMLKRRAVVVEHLKENYKARKGSVDNIINACKTAGITKVTRAGVNGDTQLYRGAFIYFTGDDKERKTIEKNMTAGHPNTSALRCLLEDGFDSWEKIQDAVSEKTAEDECMEIENDQQSDRDKTPSLIQPLMAFLQEIDRAMRIVIERSEAIDLCLKEIDAHQETIGSMQKQLKALEALDPKNIAALLPNLSKIVELDRKQHPTVEDLVIQLPQKIVHRGLNKPIKYHKRFTDALGGLQNGEFEQVKKALDMFSKEGGRQSSLQSKKIYESSRLAVPRDSWSSRASQELRFVWNRASNQTDIFYLIRRGDPRYGASEGGSR